ncbi:MAG TPA: glycerophosphodiester phosphodiesterase family protein [Bacteroidia bacterium]|nr:glycerophosphodiester phosphodiesterase family protein [Bacteroidia bacterium]
MKKNILLLSLLILISCRKERFVIDNLNGNRIIALGHAGMGLGNDYPMNSAESILQCLNIGMDGTEFDVQLTRDSVLVAFHDPDLSNSTTLKGVINSLSWAEVKRAQYTQKLYLNYSIVSLEDLFSNIYNLQQFKFTFDCKLYTENTNTTQFYEFYIRAIIRILQKYQLEDNAFIESQDIAFLRLFKSKKADYKLFIYPASFEEGLSTAKAEQLFGITISSKNITAEQIKLAHENNLWVAIWNTHTEADNKEAIRKSPDCIQTDKAKNLLKLLK